MLVTKIIDDYYCNEVEVYHGAYKSEMLNRYRPVEGVSYLIRFHNDRYVISFINNGVYNETIPVCYPDYEKIRFYLTIAEYLKFVDDLKEHYDYLYDYLW